MTTLGKYELHEILGKGGYGTVYRATDQSLGRVVALKILHPQLSVDPEFIHRFQQEARIVASLEHPNIVGLYEIGEIEGRFYFAMKYLPGGSLADLLRQGPLSWERAAAILEQVCAGLQQLHEQGWVHRDLKPSNILFDKEGRAVVGDFGLARALTTSGSSASSTAGAGTPFYRAPELWMGKPPATPATDVYSLGCILGEMLTGRPLFAGETPDQVLARHFMVGADFGEHWPPEDAPAGVKAFVEKALARDPGERFADARSFKAAMRNLENAKIEVLEQDKPEVKENAQAAEISPADDRPNLDLSSHKTIHGGPGLLVEGENRPINKKEKSFLRQAPIWVSGLVLLLALLLFVVLLSKPGYGSASPTATTAPMVQAEIPTAAPMVQASSDTTPSITLPQQAISPENAGFVRELMRINTKVSVLTASYSSDGKLLAIGTTSRIELYDPISFTMIRSINTDASIKKVAFSPDNVFLAAVQGNDDISLWKVSDGDLVRVLKGHSSEVRSIAFSPDRTLLASGSSDKTIRLWRLSDGSLVRELKGLPSWVETVAFSVDGSLLASGLDDNTIQLWKVVDGSLMCELKGHTGGVESVVFSPKGDLLASGADDRTIRLWQISDGSLVRELDGHASWVKTIAFSPDGTLLASGSMDDTIRLWRVSDGSLAQELKGHISWVSSVVFSPDGTQLVSGSNDGTVRFWGIAP